MVIKTYKISIPDTIKKSLKRQAKYIANKQQSPVIASKWLTGIIDAIESLSNFPDRCPVAPENSYIYKNPKQVIRHFVYKKSFRIIFTVIKNEVVILSVKHSAQIPL